MDEDGALVHDVDVAVDVVVELLEPPQEPLADGHPHEGEEEEGERVHDDTKGEIENIKVFFILQSSYDLYAHYAT